jgi:hypothetical protein
MLKPSIHLKSSGGMSSIFQESTPRPRPAAPVELLLERWLALWIRVAPLVFQSGFVNFQGRRRLVSYSRRREPGSIFSVPYRR